MCDETKKSIENLRRLLMESEPPITESNDKSTNSTDRTTQNSVQSSSDSGFKWVPLAGLIVPPEEITYTCSQENDDICDGRINRIVFTDAVDNNQACATSEAIAALRSQLEHGDEMHGDEIEVSPDGLIFFDENVGEDKNNGQNKNR